MALLVTEIRLRLHPVISRSTPWRPSRWNPYRHRATMISPHGSGRWSRRQPPAERRLRFRFHVMHTTGGRLNVIFFLFTLLVFAEFAETTKEDYVATMAAMLAK